MLTPRAKSPLPKILRRVEPTMLHNTGQPAQHTTDWAIGAPGSKLDLHPSESGSKHNCVSRTGSETNYHVAEMFRHPLSPLLPPPERTTAFFFFFFFFGVPQLYLWGSPLWGEIFAYVTVNGFLNRILLSPPPPPLPLPFLLPSLLFWLPPVFFQCICYSQSEVHGHSE